MFDVFLTEDEESQCLAWAIAINEHKAALNKPGRFRGVNELEARVIGIRAELAVAKALEIPFNVEIFDGGDGGIDLTLPAPLSFGSTVQVKHRNRRETDLATNGLNFHRELKADLYVLTWRSEDGAITLVGWCTKEDFIKRIIEKPPARLLGLKYEIRWKDLRPINELLAMTRLTGSF
jgi:hypothetical protein